MPVELTPQHLSDLRDLEATLNNVRAEIDRAEAAGLDVSALRDQLDQMEAIRAGLLKVYGGSKRRKLG